jgi:hypothetical protein
MRPATVEQMGEFSLKAREIPSSNPFPARLVD